MAPVAATLSGRIATTDGTHPSALREIGVAVDRDVAIDAEGLPVCDWRQLSIPSAHVAGATCRDSIVGRGIAHIEVDSSGPTLLSVPLTLFNGGARGGITTLFVRSWLPTPTPAALITIVKLRKDQDGLKAVVKIPRIAEGGGSLRDFRLTLKRLFGYRGESRSYLRARCSDGRFETLFEKILFRNEAGTPGVAAVTELRGSLAQPCTPTG
jgi:hypothetical protein